MTSITRVLSDYKLSDKLLSEIDIVSLSDIRWVSPAFRRAVEFHIKRHWNINRYLLRWFPDPLMFRSMLAWTGGIISGIQAFQFLKRSGDEKELSMFVYWRHASTLVDWVQGSGYRVSYGSPWYPDARFLDISLKMRQGSHSTEQKRTRNFFPSFTLAVIKMESRVRPGGLRMIYIVVTSVLPVEAILRSVSSSMFSKLFQTSMECLTHSGTWNSVPTELHNLEPSSVRVSRHHLPASNLIRVFSPSNGSIFQTVRKAISPRHKDFSGRYASLRFS
jgi:hypothetical protein